MATVWTILRNGRSQTLQNARIRALSVTKRSSGEETLSLTAGLDAPRFFQDEQITIFRNGRRWWQGRATQGDRSYSPDSETIDVEFANAWQFWSDASAVYSWKNGAEEAMVTRGFAGLGGDAATRADKLSVGKWLKELATRCRRLGADSQNGDSPFEIGTIECETFIPPLKLAEMTWAAAVDKIREQVPELVVYWDYNGPVPRIHMRRASELTEINIGAGAVSFFGKRVVVELLNPSRARMAPRGVAIKVRRQVEKEEKGENGETLYTTTWRDLNHPSGVKAGWRNVVTETIDESLDNSDDRWEIPPELAREYYRFLATPTWQGTLRVKGDDPLDELTPGRVLNVTNSLVDFATMRAVIHSATFDVFSGVTTCDFGPADSLGFDTFRQLLSYRRKRRYGLDVDKHHIDEMKDGESSSPTYGFGENEREAKEGRQEVQIKWCDGGAEKTATFYVSNLA